MPRRRDFEARMSREIESHLEQTAHEYISRSLSPAEARLRARRVVCRLGAERVS